MKFLIRKSRALTKHIILASESDREGGREKSTDGEQSIERNVIRNSRALIVHTFSVGELSVGMPVNLERAAAMDGRNSGHMVQGHIDDVGEVIETWPDNESLFFKVRTRSCAKLLSSS